MGKFNKKDEGVKPTIVNHMGEKAYKPNAEEELVSTVMTTMLSDSYYEKEKDKVNRIKDLMDHIQGYGSEMFYRGSNILNIAGWSESIFDVINSKFCGYKNMIEEIKKIKI